MKIEEREYNPICSIDRYGPESCEDGRVFDGSFGLHEQNTKEIV